MIALDPVQLTGNPQDVKLNTTAACCALIANESAYGLKIKTSGSAERWLPAWTADLFDVPDGSQSITITPVLIGSLVNAPSQKALVTLSLPGERIPGIYPMALTRQTGISAGGGTSTAPPTPVNLENGAGTPVGDTSANALVADAGTDTVSSTFGVNSVAAVLASFKAQAGLTPALVAQGAVAQGSSSAVNPAYGGVPGAGSLLVALVTCRFAGTACSTAGWTKQAENTGGVSTECVAVWAKPNSAGGDAAPQFTCTNPDGVSTMHAQLFEFSNVATSSPLDQTGTNSSAANNPSIQTIAGAADSQGSDLVVMAARWGMAGTGTATFSDTFNNGATVTHAGDTGGSSLQRHSSFSFAINPSSSTVLPLGVQAWPYDSSGSSAPAAGSQASVVFAASAGKTYTLTMIAAALVNASAAGANAPIVEVLDGASVIFQALLASTATAGSGQIFALTGLALKGTKGNSMTVRFHSAVGANLESISCGAQLR